MGVRLTFGPPEPTFWENIYAAYKSSCDNYEALKNSYSCCYISFDIAMHLVVGSIILLFVIIIGYLLRGIIRYAYVQNFDSQDIYVISTAFILILSGAFIKECYDLYVMTNYPFWIETPKDIFYSLYPLCLFVYLKTLLTKPVRSSDVW